MGLSRRWPQRTLLGAVFGVTLIVLGGVVLNAIGQRMRRDRLATRVIGPVRPLAGGAGEPAIWMVQAVLHGDEADLYLPGRGQGGGILRRHGGSGKGTASAVRSASPSFALGTPPEALPVALLLQGANVDKRHYASFAAALAGEGFLVVVPNHWRTFPPLPLIAQRLLLADQRQIDTTLAALKILNASGPAPLRGGIDGQRLVVIGHSMGGLAGLEALAGRCRFPLCLGTYRRPGELRGGVFYGTDLLGHGGGPVQPIETDDRPVAMISGSRDGASSRADVQATWDQIRTRRKALLTIEGANHYAITNSGRPVNPGNLPAIHPDPNAATTDQDATITVIARWSGLFLKAEVLGDPQARAQWRRWLQESPPPGGVSVRLAS